MSIAANTDTRPWKLRGYTHEVTEEQLRDLRSQGKKPPYKKLRHQSTCRGDRALDEAMKKLEADPAIGRITVEQGW
jgi:hypothetical protein